MRRQSTTHLGDLFRSRRERGKAGLPVFSVTMGDGLVKRDTLDRKTNGTLAPEEHLLIRKGDIAYNMMRMWQGASGLAERDGIVSPAYVVVAPKKDIDPLFASYWFKSARMIYLFWAYSYGITGDRLRLYYKDFARIRVTVPPKPEQERIARVFATLDRAIVRLEELITAKQRLKSDLAQQLLTGRRRLPGFGEPVADGELPTGWKRVKYQEVARFRGGVGFPEADQGIVTEGIPFIKVSDMGLPGNSKYMVRSNNSVTPELAFNRGWAPFPPDAVVFAKVGAALLLNRRRVLATPTLIDNNMMAAIPKAGITAEYLYLSLLRLDMAKLVNVGALPSVNQRQIGRVTLTLPSTKEQQRIAAVLGAADREVTLLEKKLAALRELKKGLMQKLLTGQVRVTV